MNKLYKIKILSILSLSLIACGEKVNTPKSNASSNQNSESAFVTADAPQENETTAQFEKTLLEKHPDLKSVKYKITKIPDTQLYEVVSETGVVYTDSTADWFVSGVLTFSKNNIPKEYQSSDSILIDGTMPYTRRPAMQMLLSSLGAAKEIQDEFLKDESVSEDMKEYLNGDLSGRQMFDSLPFASGISFKFGDVKQKLAIFEDPDCKFCQAFHQELHQAHKNGLLDSYNFELISFPFIASDNHPNALSRVKTIVCNENPAETWKKWMLATQNKGDRSLDELWNEWQPINAPKPANCVQSTFVDAMQKAGKELNFEATPTFMFSDGTTYEGQISISDLKEMLNIALKNRQAQPENAGGAFEKQSELAQQASKMLQELTTEADQNLNE